MPGRSLVVLCAASALVATPARAEPPGRDVGGGDGTVTLGPASATLSEARGFLEGPWMSRPPTWVESQPPPGSASFLPFQRPLFPELTLKLRPLFGVEPFLAARALLPLRPGSGIDGDFGFRYRAGRFQAGASFRFTRDSRGLALDTLAYARYVAPTYHVGLSDDARLPLVSNVAATQRLAASAGYKPSAKAPALHVSASVLDSGTQPNLAAGAFGRF